MATVFVSYAGADSAFAAGVVDELHKAGIAAYFAPTDQRSGPFATKLAHEIQNARAVAVVVSHATTDSTWVSDEVHLARQLGKPLIPIVVGDFERAPAWLKLTMSALQRYRTPADLVKAVRGLAGRGRVISVLNMKGGVGKTILTANLSSAVWARDSLDTVLVDFDPQHNLTQLFLSRERKEAFWEKGVSVKSLLLETSSTQLPSLSGGQPGARFDLVPGTDELLEYTLGLLPASEIEKAGEHFRRSLERLRDQYKVILIDLNPAATFLTRCALESSDHVLVPVRPEQFSALGLNLLKRLVEYHSSQPNFPRLPTDFTTVLNGVGERSLLSADSNIDETVRAHIQGSPHWRRTLCPTAIPSNGFLKAARTEKIPLLPLSVTAQYRRYAQRQLKEVLYGAGRWVFDRAGVEHAS